MRNTRKITLALALAVASLCGCTVYQPAPAPAPAQAVRPTPYQVGVRRKDQIERRIGEQYRRIDARVNQGYIDPNYGAALHHRVDVIRQELRDMAGQRNGAISADEERVLNQQLNDLSHQIG